MMHHVGVEGEEPPPPPSDDEIDGTARPVNRRDPFQSRLGTERRPGVGRSTSIDGESRRGTRPADRGN